jgi:hypothetical protein
MNVIDPNLSFGFCQYARRQREERRGAYEVAPGKHVKV